MVSAVMSMLPASPVAVVSRVLVLIMASPDMSSAPVVMFTLPLVFGWLAPYLRDYFPDYNMHPIAFGLVGDFLFVGSLFVLGGEFWDKLRALFIHNARVELVTRAGAPGTSDMV